MSLHFPDPATDSNIGGCNSFSFIGAEKIIVLATNSDQNTVTELVVTGGHDFFTGYSTWGTLRFDEQTQQNASGTYYSVRIRGFYPSLSYQAGQIFNNLRGKSFVVKIKDNNLVTRLAGTPETPLTFSFEATSGRSPSARSGYAFEFSGQLLKPCPMIP